jgi:hypothetical protein
MCELCSCINLVHNSVDGDNGSIVWARVLKDPFRFYILKRKRGSEGLKETLIPVY